MDPKISSITKILHSDCIITILTLLATLAKPAFSMDSKFEACAPKNCGNGPDISYPFWLANVQESFCGYPNFKIACNDKRNPILTISNDDYIIKGIFYNYHSIFVANAPSHKDSCPSPKHNLSLDRTPFSLFPGYANFSFFYNCSSKPNLEYYVYPLSCSANSTVVSYYSFHLNLLEHDDSSLLETCQDFVNAPVITGGDINSLVNMSYSEVLMKGFLLNWTAPNCSTCESSGGRCGFENNEFICFCYDKPHSISCHHGGKGNKKVTKAIIGVSTGIGSAAIVCLGFIIYLRCKKRQDTPSSYVSRSISSDPSARADIEKGSQHLGVHLFSYAELEEATNNFDEKQELGDGGFGIVYYGELKDGRAVAVKRLYENNYKRVEQFMNEVLILTRLRHQNLVTLYGCTSRHSRELLVVYEYVSNGTVADHIHGEMAKPGSLQWPMRLNIAVETARALAYLHASDIIHRDVKTENILLDKNFCVKVADFGLSRLFPLDVTHISTAPQGTPGYVDPEYYQCYQLTDKSDVYSFGVVLAELISSLPAVDITRHRHEINLSNMLINKIQSRALHELIDPSLDFDSDFGVRKRVSEVAELAFQCLQSAKELRPNMEVVLETLKEIQAMEYILDKEADKDTPSDDIGLLKYGPKQLSPDSVNINWISNSTTPNTSS